MRSGRRPVGGPPDPGRGGLRCGQIGAAWDLDAFAETAKNEIPLQRGDAPQEVVGAALYFAGAASAYTTGAVLKVDGGTSFAPAQGGAP